MKETQLARWTACANNDAAIATSTWSHNSCWPGLRVAELKERKQIKLIKFSGAQAIKRIYCNAYLILSNRLFQDASVCSDSWSM